MGQSSVCLHARCRRGLWQNEGPEVRRCTLGAENSTPHMQLALQTKEQISSSPHPDHMEHPALHGALASPPGPKQGGP